MATIKAALSQSLKKIGKLKMTVSMHLRSALLKWVNTPLDAFLQGSEICDDRIFFALFSFSCQSQKYLCVHLYFARNVYAISESNYSL